MVRIIILVVWIVVMKAEGTAQKLIVYPLKLEQLEERIQNSSDTLYVVNFWATWCKPCIEELPFLMAIDNQKYKNKPVKLLLISLDFASQIESRLIPFMKSKEIKSEVYLLDEKDPNVWIPRVNKSWSGAIPATLFVFQKKQMFCEGGLTPDLINNYLYKTLISEL